MFTVRIRRMGEGNSFSLFVCPHRGVPQPGPDGGGGVPWPGPDGGGVPGQVQTGGTLARNGEHPIQSWGTSLG